MNTTRISPLTLALLFLLGFVALGYNSLLPASTAASPKSAAVSTMVPLPVNDLQQDEGQTLTAQNYSCSLTSSTYSPGFVRLTGYIQVTPNTLCTVRFYSRPDCSSSSNPLTDRFLWQGTITTNSTGAMGFAAGLYVNVAENSAMYYTVQIPATIVTSNCLPVGGTQPTPTPTPIRTPTPTPTPVITPTPTPTPVVTPTPTPVPTPTPTPVPTPTPTPLPIITPTPTPTPIITPPNVGGTGAPFPADSVINDQKPGSILMYPVYTSDPSNPLVQNTRIAITNVDTRRDVAVHLFFVDGSSCSVADAYICLTPNQTATFFANQFDPGTTGYLVAVATDSNGCPIAHNALIGDEYVKFASGHEANLTAEAFAAQVNNPAQCDGNLPYALLHLNGYHYNAAPRVLASSSIGSRADGNDTMLIINRVGGDLLTGVTPIGPIFGIFYDAAENPASFGFTAPSCQFRATISNEFPRLTPRFSELVKQGQTGWFKLSQFSGTGIVGATINGSLSGGDQVFKGGRNLHKLTIAPSATFTVPVFPPACT